jgi:hypothetical protein
MSQPLHQHPRFAQPTELRQAVEQSGANFDKAIEGNAKIQAELLRTSSTVTRDALEMAN